MKYRTNYTVYFSERQIVFQAYVFPKIIQMDNRMMKIFEELPRRHTLKDEQSYIKLSDLTIKEFITEYRNVLFDVIHSNEFCSIFPEMRKLRRLELSDMRKCVFLMVLLGFEIEYISNLLYSNKQSIYTMKSELLKAYPNYFKS